MSESQYPPGGGPNQAMPPASPPPVAQSGWVQQQPAQSGWVMPTAAAQAPGKVSFQVILAALFLLLVGVLTGIAGAALVAGGDLVGQFRTAETGTGFFEAVGGILAGVGVVMIVWALMEVFASFGMLLRRGFGRAIGFVVGLIGAVFTGFWVLVSFRAMGEASAANAGAFAVVVLVIFLGYVFTVYALARGGGHFRRG